MECHTCHGWFWSSRWAENLGRGIMWVTESFNLHERKKERERKTQPSMSLPRKFHTNIHNNNNNNIQIYSNVINDFVMGLSLTWASHQSKTNPALATTGHLFRVSHSMVPKAALVSVCQQSTILSCHLHLYVISRVWMPLRYTKHYFNIWMWMARSLNYKFNISRKCEL